MDGGNDGFGGRDHDSLNRRGSKGAWGCVAIRIGVRAMVNRTGAAFGDEWKGRPCKRWRHITT